MNKKMDNDNSSYVQMLDICGEFYYLDVKELDKFLLINTDKDSISSEHTMIYYNENDEITSRTVSTDNQERGKQYDNVKFEMIRYLLENLTLEIEDYDPSLGINKAFNKMPLSAKLAFNTLAGYGILKKY